MARHSRELAATAPDLGRFVPLHEAAIRRQTDSQSFKRGDRYYRSGHLFNLALRGALLSGSSLGSSGGPYRVTAELTPVDAGEDPVQAISCTCPRGGFCKHIVALLLAWVREPETFTEGPVLKEVLASKSQGELIALIEVMINLFPELEDVLELPLPDMVDGDGAPVQEATTRRQVAAAMQAAYAKGEWAAAPAIVAALQPLMRAAEARADAGRWSDAITIWRVVAEEIIDQGQLPYDHEGDMDLLLAEAEAGLARALESQAGLPEEQRLSDDERAELIQSLLDLWLSDGYHHELEISVDTSAIIARSATPEELARVETWLRSQIANEPEGEQFIADWNNRIIVHFLAALKEAAGATDDEILAEYEGAGLWMEVVEMLIDLDRYDEAVALARRRIENPHLFLRFAERLASPSEQHHRQAVSMIEDRLWEMEGKDKNVDQVYQAWLGEQYAKLGDSRAALRVKRRLFEAQPTQTTFTAIRDLATRIGMPTEQWMALRTELLRTLRDRARWQDLVEVHLEAREHADALAALSEVGSRNISPYTGLFGISHGGTTFSAAPGGAVPYGDQRLHVAKAVAKTHPDEAISLYQAVADEQIEKRNRDAYAQAATHLKAARAIFHHQKREGEWLAYIGALRQKTKTLRALQDELDRAKLEPGERSA
ncbi:MAG TPA: SWIM zinc finger family protein [Thermomicrobiales bacterium]|nr:SWIM zinc finger family protein [Thermomicrobiales bacterium]